eukprot:840427-Prymnesium_polylepis.3
MIVGQELGPAFAPTFGFCAYALGLRHWRSTFRRRAREQAASPSSQMWHSIAVRRCWLRLSHAHPDEAEMAGRVLIQCMLLG